MWAGMWRLNSATGSRLRISRLQRPSALKRGEEWKDAAEWHHLVFSGRQAEIVREYVEKGSKIYVEGRLKTR